MRETRVEQETGNLYVALCILGLFCGTLRNKMASKSSDSSGNVEKIFLEEQDIPGAELPKPAEQIRTCVNLKS